jgi:hypothetical protein
MSLLIYVIITFQRTYCLHLQDKRIYQCFAAGLLPAIHDSRSYYFTPPKKTAPGTHCVEGLMDLCMYKWWATKTSPSPGPLKIYLMDLSERYGEGKSFATVWNRTRILGCSDRSLVTIRTELWRLLGSIGF